MARIAGVDIPRDKRVEIALTYIYGIGRTRSIKVLTDTNINKDIRYLMPRLLRFAIQWPLNSCIQLSKLLQKLEAATLWWTTSIVSLWGHI